MSNIGRVGIVFVSIRVEGLVDGLFGFINDARHDGSFVRKGNLPESKTVAVQVVVGSFEYSRRVVEVEKETMFTLYSTALLRQEL